MGKKLGFSQIHYLHNESPSQNWPFLPMKPVAVAVVPEELLLSSLGIPL
jgi:hypothetical protein